MTQLKKLSNNKMLEERLEQVKKELADEKEKAKRMDKEFKETAIEGQKKMEELVRLEEESRTLKDKISSLKHNQVPKDMQEIISSQKQEQEEINRQEILK